MLKIWHWICGEKLKIWHCICSAKLKFNTALAATNWKFGTAFAAPSWKFGTAFAAPSWNFGIVFAAPSWNLATACVWTLITWNGMCLLLGWSYKQIARKVENDYFAKSCDIWRILQYIKKYYFNLRPVYMILSGGKPCQAGLHAHISPIHVHKIYTFQKVFSCVYMMVRTLATGSSFLAGIV